MVLCALLLASCSPSGAVKLLTGGGPNVAANGQAGKTNVQAIGETVVTDQKIIRPQARSIEQSSGDTRVKADRVETVVVNETPVWLVIALVVAVFLDSPLRWPGQFVAGFRRWHQSA
nr:bacteriophage spanin2 family protein [Thalassovita aquimarina]